ncbi:MAG: hypothetical protein ACREMV_05630, partial [Gemmatimonadales bacterium]
MTPSRPLHRTIAVLLLALQGAAGSALPLVHASEQAAAPVAIEREHGPSCPIMHDAARCAACQHLIPDPASATPRWATAGLEGAPAEQP